MREPTARPLGSRYELDREIGRGATAVVWSGRVRETGERVAVKVLRSHLTADHQLVARFAAERAVLTAVDHPNLVRVHDLVVEAGVLALVFEYVDGVSLRDHLRAGALPAPEAMAIGAALARALAALHAADIVHCDVKPANVLLPPGEQARLADLGLAWLVRSERSDLWQQPAGTPGYLAPELALGAVPAPSADVYALGVVLYEMLTGRSPEAMPTERRAGARLPMQRKDQAEHGVGDEASVRAERIPDVPRELWRAVGACLRAKPTARPSAATLAAALALTPPLSPEPPGDALGSQPARQPAGLRHEGVSTHSASPVPPATTTDDLPTVHRVEEHPPDGPHVEDLASPRTVRSEPAGSGGGRAATAAPGTVRRTGAFAVAAATAGCLLVVGVGLALGRSVAVPANPPASRSSAAALSGHWNLPGGSASANWAEEDSRPDPARMPRGPTAVREPSLDPVPDVTGHGAARRHDVVESYEAVGERLERYVAPTGWLCRQPAAIPYGGGFIEVQPCIAVGRTTARAALRHALIGPSPELAPTAATLRLMTDHHVPPVLAAQTCGLPTTDAGCPEVTADVVPGAAYYAVVSVEIRGSSAKALTLSTPIIQNYQPQDHNNEEPSTDRRST